MKKLLMMLMLICMLFLLVSCNNKVDYSNKAVVSVDISELVQDDWFDYSYFWQSGKDENGNDLTIVTIYYSTKYGHIYTKKYVTDGKIWEAVE